MTSLARVFTALFLCQTSEAIPCGTPVWLPSTGPMVPLQKLVMARDTGSAITGAVRADYFAG